MTLGEFRKATRDLPDDLPILLGANTIDDRMDQAHSVAYRFVEFSPRSNGFYEYWGDELRLLGSLKKKALVIK